MLYRRTPDGGMEVTHDVAVPPIEVPLEFASVESVRWCPERGELLAAATPHGGATPSVAAAEKGDRRLYACTPDSGEWRQIGAGFADDPVATRDAYVVSRGGGIAVMNAGGDVRNELKQGRFNWGPPSLSLSRGGSFVAWVRWRGDNKRLCVLGLDTNEATEFAHSLYSYAWVDDETLVYMLGGPPSALDVRTGRSRRFLPERYGDIAATGDRIWLADEFQRRLFTTEPDGSNVTEVWAARRRERIERLVPHGDSVWLVIAVYRRLSIVRREERWVGLEDDGSGWAPLLDCHQPEFGFLLPFEDERA